MSSTLSRIAGAIRQPHSLWQRAGSSLVGPHRPALEILAAAQVTIFLMVLAETVMLVPFSDMISWLGQYAAFKRDGGLLHYLFLPHNEHRLATIRILTICDVELFGGRGIAFIIAATTSLFGILALVWRELKRAEPIFGPGKAIATACVLTVPAAMDCSIPINTLYPITAFFVFLSIVMMEDGRGNRLPLSLLAAAIASLTNAIGIIVWPILLWHAWLKRARGLWLAAMCALAAVLSGVFFFGDHPSNVTARSITDVVQYWPSFVGLPWSRFAVLATPASAIGIGLVVAALVLAASRLKDACRIDRIPIAFVLFSLGCSVFAAIGRSGLHEPYPPVRYSIFMMPLHLALLFFVLNRKWLSMATAVALLFVLTGQQFFAGYMAIHAARGLGVPVGF
jgi:hypothetical protein